MNRRMLPPSQRRGVRTPEDGRRVDTPEGFADLSVGRHAGPGITNDQFRAQLKAMTDAELADFMGHLATDGDANVAIMAGEIVRRLRRTRAGSMTYAEPT